MGKRQDKTSRADWPPSTPAALLQLLEANGGVVSVIDPPKEVRAAWRSLLHLLRRDGHTSRTGGISYSAVVTLVIW